MIKKHFLGWVLFFLLLVAAWLDRIWPLTDAPVVRCEPFSLSAFLISLAVSAASFGVQLLLRPKTPKVTRGQQSGELFIQNADEGSPVAEIYGGAPNNAITSQSVTWTGLVNCVINADGGLEKTSGDDDCFEDATGTGDGGAWSVEQVIDNDNDWEVSFTFGAEPSGRVFCGLTDGVFSLDYADWDYAWHVSTENNTIDPHPPNSIFVYEAGVQKAFEDGVWASGDTLRVRSISGVITYWWKDTLIYTSARTPTYPMKLIASIACLNSTVDSAVIAQTQDDVRGGIKTAGTVIWCREPRKVVTTERKGGKGAPKQTVETITYYTDLAILFARGRQRLKKLWANADLIIDLDAAIGESTGMLDSGAISVTPYSTTEPPSPLAGVINPNTFIARSVGATISGSIGAGGASMRFYEGNYDQLPDSLIEADVGAGNAPAYRGFAYLVIENFNISKYGGVPTFLATLENVDYRDLDDIANHLCERVGIEPGDRDFSVFDGESVRGLIVNDPQAPRETLELAATPYDAEFYETVDGILTGTYFGGASVATIDADELGMQDGDRVSVAGEMGDKLEFGLTVDDQLPRQISVTAFDPGKDHETTTQHAYRMQGFAQGVEQISLPMALLPDEARQSAERLLYRRHVERESALVRPPWKYCWINPTDIVTVVSAGITHNLRWAQVAGAVPGLLEIQAVAEADTSQDVSNCVTTGGEQDVVWDCPVGWEVDGNDLESDGTLTGTDCYNHFALSIESQAVINPGDYFTWKIGSLGALLAVGGTYFDCEDFQTIGGECLFYFGADSLYFYYDFEPPEYQATAGDLGVEGPFAVGSYDHDTVFKIIMAENGDLELYVDDLLVRTQEEPFDGPYRLGATAGRDVDLALEGSDPIGTRAQVLDAKFFSASSPLTTICPTYTPPVIPAPSDSIALLVDTVMLRDADNAAGYYAAIVPRTDGAWSGAALYRDRGAGYEPIETFLAPAVAGVLVNPVTPDNVTTFDDLTTVTVDLYGTDATLESATELQVLNGANAAILGDGMIFQFTTATQVGGFDNRWALTGLLWGRRGSDFALGTFAAGSRFLLLDGAVVFIENDLAERGISRNFKAVTNGFAIDDVPPTSFNWNCRTLMPLSVVDVEGERDMSDNLTITWVRRTRIGGQWMDGQDVPLGESLERYEIEIYDGPDVVRTITVNDAQTATYTAADQTTDFGSPQPSIDIAIYQISGTVGRGFVRTATV